MKKMILLAALTLSSSAFAYMCEVDMVDNRTNRRITTIRVRDDRQDCKEGMKQCRLEIRQRGLLGRADCVRRGTYNPYPNPNPNPYPNPNPNPYPNPYPSTDARRMLNNGESAIHNNRYVTVIGISYNGTYAVRSTDGWNTMYNNIRRDQLSVTNGCSQGLCTNDSVIDVRYAKYVNIVGISYDEDFVTKSTDGWNTLTSNVRRSDLAETKGCLRNVYPQLCVGNTVIDTFNRYSTIAGIQLNGKVVLRSEDGWNTLTTNVDANRLIVTQ